MGGGLYVTVVGAPVFSSYKPCQTNSVSRVPPGYLSGRLNSLEEFFQKHLCAEAGMLGLKINLSALTF